MSKLKKLTSRCIAFVMALLLICSGIIDNVYFMSSKITGNISGAVTAEAATTGTVNADTFSWDNALVYFLLTDRFKNGDTSNDHSYSRGLNQSGSVVQGVDNRATFHGGDFKGITQTIKDGYFNDLGVNALWISAPYEQIHGYIVGGPNFLHYSYHGYYVLDYTNSDANFGTMKDFQELVDTAHEHGLRVIIDIVLNHAGYNSMYDMNEYGFGGTLKSGWQDYYYKMSNISDYHNYIDYDSNEWTKWWGPDWIRAGLPGYTEGGNDDLTQSLTGLPDFKTESTKTVGIPEFLTTKWKREGRYDEEVAELKAYLSSHGYDMTVTNCISYWLSTWVRDYGVDGFRCDTAKHVEYGSWKRLKEMCTDALKTWKANNPDKKLDDLNFWMTGEAWGHGVSYDGYYTQGGFDSMINFATEGGGALASGSVENTYKDYASAVNTNPNFNILSYISSHDSRLTRGDMIYTGSALLLLPGGVQIYYGDETNRPLVNGVNDGNGGAGHGLRSDMNWDSMDKTVLAHWQKVGRFRSNHMAVGAGENKTVTATSGHAFTRTYSNGSVSDRVAFCIGANANTQVTIDVSSVWSDGESVVNYYDDSSAVVTGGKVTFNSGANGTILIGDADGKPLVSFAGDAKFKGTQQITVSLDGAESATVSVDGGKKFIVHNGDTFTIGETAYEGDTVTISYTVTNENGTANGKVDFYKEYENQGQEEEDDEQGLVRVKMSDGSAPYLYAWKDKAEYAGAWPGKQLTEKDGEGYYYCKLETTDTYNVIFNGNNGKQTDDIVGLSGKVTFEVSSDYKTCTKIETDDPQSKYALMKKEARAVKNMTSEDYTSDSWNNLYSNITKADELVALGEKKADAAQVETIYNDIVKAKNALVLVAPTVTTAEIGSKEVSGTAPCESTVKVTVNGANYTATADEVTGIWSIVAGSDLSSTSTIETSCVRNGLESATDSYTLPIITDKGKVIVKYVDESGEEIKTSTTLTGIVGTAYMTTAVKIEGYILKSSPDNAKGKYTEEDITVTYVYQQNQVTEKTGKVIVRYVDESENEIKTSITLEGIVGEDYETAEVNIEGYTLKTSPANAKGKYTEEDITVTYVYQQNNINEKTGKVIVRYVDESDNQIKESTTLTGTVGEDYETSAAEIEGYTLKTGPSNAKGKYTKEDITVTYVYQQNDINEKTGKVIVRYVDESDNQIKTSTTVTGIVGVAYETTEAEIEGYTLKTKPANAKGTYTEAEITVTYVYQKSTTPTPETKGKVIVRYVDESDNQIKTSTTLTGTVGEDYETSAAEIEGYTLKTSPSNAKGTYTEAEITVTYVYQKSTTPTPETKGKVIVRYVDDSDKEIKGSTTLTGTVGEDYETSAAEIEGYTLKTSPSNAKGKYTKEDITVTYVYQENAITEKTGKVIVRYVDESDKEIKASTILTGTVGADYEAPEAKVEGYTIKMIPANAKGKYTEEDITATFVYSKNTTSEYEKVSITSFKMSKASNTITTGQTIRMTANATGGDGELKYQFVVKLGNDKNQTVRKYSLDNSCQWIPAKSGKYTLYVYVKDSSTGEIVKKSINNYSVKPALKIKSFTQSRKSGTAVVGDKVIVSVNTTGGIGQKFYRYYYKLNGKKYVIKENTTSKKVNWTPKKAGKYQLFVEVTDDMDNKITKKVNYVVVDKLKVKSLKANTSSVKVGQKVKLSAAATGGTKGYSYKFKYEYKNKSVAINSYSRSSSVMWTPRYKGKYKITVYVKDAKNRKATKTMTINVK